MKRTIFASQDGNFYISSEVFAVVDEGCGVYFIPTEEPNKFILKSCDSIIDSRKALKFTYKKKKKYCIQEEFCFPEIGVVVNDGKALRFGKSKCNIKIDTYNEQVGVAIAICRALYGEDCDYTKIIEEQG